jgi:alkylation response protein AidB-like acyl-CoA dehydrogenase
MSVVVSNGQETLRLVLDEEQQMLRSTARQFVDQHAPVGRLRTLRDTRDPRGFSDDLWREMAGLGWLGCSCPRRTTGSGSASSTLAVVLEQCGRRLMPEPLVSTLLLGAQACCWAEARRSRRPGCPESRVARSSSRSRSTSSARAATPMRGSPRRSAPATRSC